VSADLQAHRNQSATCAAYTHSQLTSAKVASEWQTPRKTRVEIRRRPGRRAGATRVTADVFFFRLPGPMVRFRWDHGQPKSIQEQWSSPRRRLPEVKEPSSPTGRGVGCQGRQATSRGAEEWGEAGRPKAFKLGPKRGRGEGKEMVEIELVGREGADKGIRRALSITHAMAGPQRHAR